MISRLDIVVICPVDAVVYPFSMLGKVSLLVLPSHFEGVPTNMLGHGPLSCPMPDRVRHGKRGGALSEAQVTRDKRGLTAGASELLPHRYVRLAPAG
jgi:hypothetical protein